jgi:hypothetical protein
MLPLCYHVKFKGTIQISSFFSWDMGVICCKVLDRRRLVLENHVKPRPDRIDYREIEA